MARKGTVTKKYDKCIVCKIKLIHYRYNALCGKCYLIHKQEEREQKGLE